MFWQGTVLCSNYPIQYIWFCLYHSTLGRKLTSLSPPSISSLWLLQWDEEYKFAETKRKSKQVGWNQVSWKSFNLKKGKKRNYDNSSWASCFRVSISSGLYQSKLYTHSRCLKWLWPPAPLPRGRSGAQHISQVYGIFSFISLFLSLFLPCFLSFFFFFGNGLLLPKVTIRKTTNRSHTASNFHPVTLDR